MCLMRQPFLSLSKVVRWCFWEWIRLKMVGSWTVTLTYLLHQLGCEEIHRSHQLQREDLQHVHTVWKVYFLWQWRRAGVRVEYRHRWGWRHWFKSIFSRELTPLFWTGDAVAVYSELCYPTALHGVAFHPHENMVAFCAFGPHQPIHTYLYDHKGVFDITLLF